MTATATATETSAGSVRQGNDTSGAGRTAVVAGTGALIRLILRRDRLRLLLWTIGVVGFVTVSATSVPELYPSAAELQDRGQFVQSPVLAIFTGPGFGVAAYTVGAMVANEYLIYCLVAVALMSIFLVIRHTRAEEESGRAELVRASVVGPYAAPAAALVVALIANVVIGAGTAAALALSVDELPAGGSWTFGMSMAATGLVFAALTAVAAQVTEHTRAATGIAVGALVVAFSLRALGDSAGDRTLSWLSPLGWAQSTRAYVDERWWPLGLSLATAVAMTALAFALASRRDIAAGLVPPRPGPPHASRSLASSSGLALRLQRGTLLTWAVGLTALGAAFGAALGDVEAFLTDNPQLQEVFGADDGPLLENFLDTVLVLMSLLTTACALTTAMSARREEVAGHAEAVLATAISRVRWAAGHLAVALGGGTAVMLCATAGVGAAAAVERRDLSWFFDVLAAGISRLPAIWFVIAVAAALYGLASRAAPWSWILLTHATVVGLMGNALDLPDGAHALSPFHHVPDLPGGDVHLLPLLTLSATAAALLAVGLAAITRRDITTN